MPALKEARKKIIYVDDVNSSLFAFKKALKDHYEIFLADSTDKLYKILKKVKPDLIFLDVNMPDTGGYQIIKILKEDKRYSDIPVIFMTSNDDKESIQEGLKLGAAAYVVKPFNALKLVETINKKLYQKERV